MVLRLRGFPRPPLRHPLPTRPARSRPPSAVSRGSILRPNNFLSLKSSNGKPGPKRPGFFLVATPLRVLEKSGCSSWPGPNAGRKRRRRSGNRARILRGPAGIGHGVPAKRCQIVDDVAQRDRPVERLRINLIILRASDRQFLQGKRTIKLRRAGIAATPAAPSRRRPRLRWRCPRRRLAPEKFRLLRRGKAAGPEDSRAGRAR